MKKNKKVTKSDKPFLVLSRRALIGWACFILFVCAWMFVVGVLVGRDTAPVKFDIAGIQKKLEAAKEDLVKKERSRIEGKSAVTKDKTKLDFYEALRDNREDTQLDKKKLSPSISKKAEPLPAKKPPRSIDDKSDRKNIGKKPPPKKKPTKPAITNEAANGLRNLRGTIAMARTPDPHSATAQFFINTVNNSFLNHRNKTQQGWGYTAFGRVIKGMDVVDVISAVETTKRAGFQDVPVQPVVIKSARRLK